MKVEEVRIDSISNHSKNPKQHPDKQIRLLQESIKRFGWTNPVILSADNTILAGHARVKAAIAAGNDTVPCIRTKLTGQEADAYLLADNRLSDIAPYDRDILAELLSDLPKDLVDLTGFDTVQVDALLSGEDIPDIEKFISDSQPEEGREEVDAEPQIDRAAELNKKWQVKTGDLWQCGEHRIICGDCTDPAVVERVMGGEKARLVFTSPPYNNSTGGFKSDYYGKKESFYKDNKVDRKTKEDWLSFCDSVLINCSHVVSDAHTVAWNVMYNADMRDAYGLSMFCGKHPFTVKETICWDKNGGFNIATKGILSRPWEFVFILSKGDYYFTTQKENEVRYAIWKVDTHKGTQMSGVHNAVFPVELPKKAIDWFSLDGDFVLDPFLGSGTTMIACENTGRKARGIEISPDYCAVILQRYQDATGKEPVRING